MAEKQKPTRKTCQSKEEMPDELKSYLNACESYINLFVDTIDRLPGIFCSIDKIKERDKEFGEVLNEIDNLVFKLPVPISPFRLNFPLVVSKWSRKIQQGGTPSYTDKEKYQTVIVQITNVNSCDKVKNALKGVESSSIVARGEAIKRLMEHRKVLTSAPPARQGEEETTTKTAPIQTQGKKKGKAKEFFKKHWQWLIAATIVPIIAPIIVWIVIKRLGG